MRRAMMSLRAHTTRAIGNKTQSAKSSAIALIRRRKKRRTDSESPKVKQRAPMLLTTPKNLPKVFRHLRKRAIGKRAATRINPIKQAILKEVAEDLESGSNLK